MRTLYLEISLHHLISWCFFVECSPVEPVQPTLLTTPDPSSSSTASVWPVEQDPTTAKGTGRRERTFADDSDGDDAELSSDTPIGGRR